MKQDIMLILPLTEHTSKVCEVSRHFELDVSQDDDFNSVRAGLALHSPAFILLDIDMKGAKHFLIEISKCILRPFPHIMVASTLLGGTDRAELLDLGADACVGKPLSTEEIRAVIYAVFRREQKISRLNHGNLLSRIEHKELIIDPLRRTVEMRGEFVSLTVKEFDILYFLADRAGTVLTKEEIYRSVWNAEYGYTTTNVSDHISLIRRKLKLDKKDKDYIQTVFGVGYRFVDKK